MKTLQLPPVFSTGGHDIDAGGLDAAVAQNIRKLCDVFAEGIKAAGKELAQIMGKHLSRIHIRRGTKPLHLRPYIAAVQWLSAACYKDASTADSPFFGKSQ